MAGLNYEMRHTMLTDAEYEDNLGKDSFFREYLYVIIGNLLNNFKNSDDILDEFFEDEKKSTI